MRKVSSTLIVVLLGVTAAVVAVSLAVTLLLPTLLQRFACAPYGMRCNVGQAKLRPRLNLTSGLVIQNITVFEHSGPQALLRARSLAVTIDLLSLIRARGVMPAEIRIDSPELSLRQLDDGRWNVMALAETVRQRLRPTTRVIPLQLPRILVTAGVLRLGATQVTGLNLSLEPRPSPLLFEAHMRAAIEGQTLEATLAVRDSLEGELRVEGREILIRGARQPFRPRGLARLRLDLPARTLTISEWKVEDQGMMANGKAVVQYAAFPPAYDLSVAAWRLELGELAERLPLPEPSVLQGQVRGEPVTLKGRWPERSSSTTSASLTGVGFHLPKKGFRVTGIGGTFTLQQNASRLRLRTDLRGESVELYGQRQARPALKATVSANLGNGDLHLEELLATASGLRLRANGIGQRWGREGWDLKTTDLTVEPKILTRIFHGPEGGIAVKALRDPSLYFRWLGGNHPWSLGLGIRSIELAIGTSGYPATLEETKVLITGEGASRDNLKGTVISRETAFGGRTLSNLIGRFEIRPDQVQIPELRFAASGGTVQGRISFSRPSPLTDLHAKLFVQGIRLTQLVPALSQSAANPDPPLDGEISAAVSGGQVSATIDLAPNVTRHLVRLLHQTPQTVPPESGEGHHLILRAKGTLGTDAHREASGAVTIQGLRSLLVGGEPPVRESPVTLTFSYQDGHLALKAQELGFSAHELAPALSRLAGLQMQGKAGTLMVSANADFGGREPPSVTGTIAIRELSLDLGRKKTAPAPFLRGLRGSLVFALDHGVLIIKETTLRDEAGFTLTLGGGLPIARDHDRPSRFHLALPSTEMSSLRTLLAAFTPARLADASFAGQIKADLEIIDRAYRGSVVLRNVAMESNLLRLERISGTIPLAGRIGQASGPARTSAMEQIGSVALSEEAYEKARRRILQEAAQKQDRHALTVALLHYGPIELRDLTASLALDSDGIAIRHFAFQLWGAEVGGWGEVFPMSREITLDLLVDGLSLQAICDAFPAIKGYISGRINGLAHLSIPDYTLDNALGGARFWAVNSPKERKEISRILIEKLAGQRIRYFSLFGQQDRRYDRGVLDVSLKRGDLVFHELDISHTTLGIKDLDIKVSPSFNKIGMAHLIESITVATERIKAKATPTP